MKKAFFVLRYFFVAFLFFSTSLAMAEEIPLGKTREFSISDHKWLAHFSKMEGRMCHVDLFEKKDDQSVFYKRFNFDFARGEVVEWIGKNKITIFYVEKGVIILVDGEEM